MKTRKITLFAAALAVLASSLLADPLVDDSMTIALWHMDAIVQVSTSRVGVADDTSVTGRSGFYLVAGQNSPDDPDMHPTVTTGGGGLYGEALQFDSSKQQQAFRDGLWTDLEGARVQFWFKQNVGVTATQSPLCVHNVFDMRATNGTLDVYVWRNVGNPVSLSASYTQGEWTSVEMTIEGEFMELVVNGNSQTRTISEGMAIATGRLFVGRSGSGDGRYFDGLIDEVKISNLNYPQFYYPYEDTYGTFALWHMDETEQEGTLFYSPDDNSDNPSRSYPLVMLHNGGGAGEGQGPQLVDGFDSPSRADFGNALYFNGNNDTSRVNISGDNLGIDGSNFRVEAWVKLDENINTYGGGNNYYIAFHNSRFALYLQDHSTGWMIAWSNWWDGGAHALTANYPDHKQWHHVAGEFYEGRRRIYIDGILVADRAAQLAANTVKDGVGSLYIGSQSATGNLFYGTIDEVRISQAEPTDAPCGHWGYHPADLDEDCYVGISDLRILVGNWLNCSIPGDPDCQQFN